MTGKSAAWAAAAIVLVGTMVAIVAVALPLTWACRETLHGEACSWVPRFETWGPSR